MGEDWNKIKEKCSPAQKESKVEPVKRADIRGWRKGTAFEDVNPKMRRAKSLASFRQQIKEEPTNLQNSDFQAIRRKYTDFSMSHNAGPRSANSMSMATTRSIWGLSTARNVEEIEPDRDQLRRSQMDSLFTARMKEYEESEAHTKMVSNLNLKKLQAAKVEGSSSLQEQETLASTRGRSSVPLRSQGSKLAMSATQSQIETLWYNDCKAPRV
jgi:hypothetical protein